MPKQTQKVVRSYKQPLKKSPSKNSWINKTFNSMENIENDTSDSDVEIIGTCQGNPPGTSKTYVGVSAKHKSPTFTQGPFDCVVTRNDLAVNKRKIEEVDAWLNKAFMNAKLNQYKPMILVLTGPTGSGKTATLRALAVSHNIQIVEWTTPMDDAVDSRSIENRYGTSQASKFEDFLLASARYDSIISQGYSKKLILVEDYPNSFLLKPELFHIIMKKYQLLGKFPLVFIATDVNFGKNIFLSLFPPKFTVELNLHQISFNSIAKKALMKCLEQASTLINQQSIATNTLESICLACNGDVRNAMLELQFVAKTLDGKINLPKPKVTQLVSRKRKADTRKMQPALKAESKVTTSGKDALTGIMHSLGRVLYGKREKMAVQGGSVDMDPRGFLKTNPQDIINQFVSQFESFTSLVHENYPAIFSDIHSASHAIEHLCHANVMNEWREKDLLIETGFSVVIRGVMNACNNPIQQYRSIQKSKWKETKEKADVYVKNLQSSSSSIGVFSKRELCLDFAPFFDSKLKSNLHVGSDGATNSPTSPLPHITDDDSDS